MSTISPPRKKSGCYHNPLLNHRGLPVVPLMQNVSFDQSSKGWVPPPELYLNQTFSQQHALAADTADSWKQADMALYKGNGAASFLHRLLQPLSVILEMVIDFFSQTVMSLASITVQMLHLPLNLFKAFFHSAQHFDSTMLLVQLGIVAFIGMRLMRT